MACKSSSCGWQATRAICPTSHTSLLRHFRLCIPRKEYFLYPPIHSLLTPGQSPCAPDGPVYSMSILSLPKTFQWIAGINIVPHMPLQLHLPLTLRMDMPGSTLVPCMLKESNLGPSTPTLRTPGGQGPFSFYFHVLPTLNSAWSREAQKKCGLGVFASMALSPQTCLHSDINLFFK